MDDEGIEFFEGGDDFDDDGGGSLGAVSSLSSEDLDAPAVPSRDLDWHAVVRRTAQKHIRSGGAGGPASPRRVDDAARREAAAPSVVHVVLEGASDVARAFKQGALLLDTPPGRLGSSWTRARPSLDASLARSWLYQVFASGRRP